MPYCCLSSSSVKCFGAVGGAAARANQSNCFLGEMGDNTSVSVPDLQWIRSGARSIPETGHGRFRCGRLVATGRFGNEPRSRDGRSIGDGSGAWF